MPMQHPLGCDFDFGRSMLHASIAQQQSNFGNKIINKATK
jgi:hypothetical protein